ncbi:MAG: methyltransferase domain-containing protein [Solirubrobacterales bacterium]|nr:methyltransferase domain-containing protein [Solirubrobacterales bacterium]
MNYERLYSYRFRDIDQQLRADVWIDIANFMRGKLGNPRAVLDPAAGRGEFINAVDAEERWAVDMVEYPEGTHDKGVNVVVSDIFDANLPNDHFDGIFISNFLEHLTTQESVSVFLEKMHAVSKPGGRIAIMGPNFRYCAKQYFNCADHTLIFDHGAIAEHLYAAGFEVEEVIPRFLPYSFRQRLPASREATRAYLRFPPAWRLLGKQFLLVGRA